MVEVGTEVDKHQPLCLDMRLQWRRSTEYDVPQKMEWVESVASELQLQQAQSSDELV